MKKIAIYQCGFCDEISELKPLCKQHESSCPSNPKLKSCPGCISYVNSESKYDSQSALSAIPTCLEHIDLTSQLIKNCDKFVAQTILSPSYIPGSSTSRIKRELLIENNMPRQRTLFDEIGLM